jgi:hypothetical protein
MKRLFTLACLCLLLVSCSLPFTINWNTPTAQAPTEAVGEPTIPSGPEATAAPAFEGTEYNLGNIYMVVPSCLAVVPTGVIEPAAPYDEMSGPQEFYPEHRKITFSGYPLSGKFFEPVIRVYPAVEYAAMHESIAGRVSDMQTLLATQPADPQSIPFLPSFNAAQVFHAQLGYLPFQNGNGARFLTEYAQYYAPVNNHDLFYAYQGLTSDGAYWVSAIFPVNLPWLQESWDSAQVPADGLAAPAWDAPNLDAAMQTYYDTMLGRLNSEAAGNFTPSLDCLDQFIQSLNVGN